LVDGRIAGHLEHLTAPAVAERLAHFDELVA